MAWPTLADYRAWAGLGATETQDDALLSGLLTRAQAIIEGPPPLGTGRTFIAASATRLVDCPLDGSRVLYLWDAGDLLSVTSITNGDGTAVAAGTYVTLPRRERPIYGLELKRGSGVAWTYSDSPEQAISITGLWGYSADVPADIAQAFYRLVDWLYRSKDGEGDRATQTDAGIILPSRLPKDVNDILDGYRSLV